jgi:predicted nucleic acid-binding protein
MVKVYADTSFLASLYFLDVHSSEAERRVRQASPIFFLTPLLELELVNALQLRMFRGEASASEIRASKSDLEKDIGSGVFATVPIPMETYELARRFATKRTSTIGARTLDILHVACASLLDADEFWTFDARQAALAKAEGLKRR